MPPSRPSGSEKPAVRCAMTESNPGLDEKPSVLVKTEPVVPPHLLPGFGQPPEIIHPADSAAGPVDAAGLIRELRWNGQGFLLLVTAKDLSAPGCASVFGYANRRRRTAVVSIHRLKSPDQALWRERIAKVAAHELLHLEGHRHCSDPGCVMHPASNLQELDRRGRELCARCRSPRLRWRAAAVAAAACLSISFLLDAGLQAVNRKSTPFSWRRESGGAAVLYRGSPVLTLSADREAQAAAAVLNRLFADLNPPPLTVQASGAVVTVEAGGQMVFQLEKPTGGDHDPLEYAQLWVQEMNPLLQGKGTASEGCPDCHTYRRDEVIEAAMQRTRFWR